MPAPRSRLHPAFPRGVIPATTGIAVALLIAFGSAACQELAGGPVLSAAEYRERVARTEAAGERVLRDLDPLPTADEGSLEEADGSCVDDFGFDDTGVTRDRPAYEWKLDFADRAAYLAAVEDLRRTWTARGVDVRRLAPDDDSGLPGVTATDGGIELTLAPDWYSEQPVLRADGGCVRHEYGVTGEGATASTAP
ncbi:hypothetical protein SUDANB105_03039 [Streptomyces sp. enrichment culture]|uniref:hypothetical protein n=1 Tax=Streptomyces sp. enrichment culture TaxID=1795815 RepID=UPI003F562ABB